jgi:TM2 domain-containing membrane protein YozV
MATLSDQQRILIETQFGNRKKSAGIAYLLLIITMVGHNFYLGRNGRGLLQLVLCLIGVGFIWVLLDLFTLAGTVRSMNADTYNQLTMDALRGA